MTIWIERSRPDPELVDLSVQASGYDADLLHDYDLDEAQTLEAVAVPLSLEAVRDVLDRRLARALARELQVPYESRN
ncbi:MAG: hypothetical protein ACR2NA_08235 [Solirubrobacterales bacterium]